MKTLNPASINQSRTFRRHVGLLALYSFCLLFIYSCSCALPPTAPKQTFIATNLTFTTTVTTNHFSFFGGTNTVFSNQLIAVIHYTTNTNFFTNIPFSIIFSSNEVSNIFLSNLSDIITNTVIATNIVTNDSNSYLLATTNETNYRTVSISSMTNQFTNTVLSTNFVTNTDWVGFDFSGANLSHLNLEGYNLSNANLSNANFISFVSKFGTNGTNDGQFLIPRSIAVDENFIYVIDSGRGDVQVFNKTSRTYASKFGGSGTNDGQFEVPRSIAVDEDFIYVADSGNLNDSGRDDVQVFNKTSLAYASKFGGSGTNDGQFQIPLGIAVDEDFIYVADSGNLNDSGRDDVQVFNKTSLAYASKFGDSGTNNGFFQNPTGIAVDDSFIYLVDDTRDDVQVFEKTSGAYVSKFGSTGTDNGQFLFPISVVVDDNFIYVVDVGSGRDDVQVFEKTSGAYVTKFGNNGTDNGQFKTPRGIAIDDDGFIYIVDSDRDDVQVLSSSLRGANF